MRVAIGDWLSRQEWSYLNRFWKGRGTLVLSSRLSL